MDKMSLIFSSTSLLLSVIALWISFKRYNIAAVVEKDRKEDKKKAKLRPEIIKEMGSKRMKDVLRIVNEGKAEAREINISINGQEISKFPHAYVDQMPIKSIGSGSEYKILLAIHDQTNFPWEVEISWKDDYAENRTYKTTVTL